MSFKFRIVTSGYFTVAKVWYVDGYLESGCIAPPVSGSALTRDGVRVITIRSIALVSTPQPEPKRLTLAIEEPTFPITLLEAGVLVSNES